MVNFFKFRTILVLKAEAVNQRCYVKKVFLKFRKIHRHTPVKFAKVLRTFFLWNTSGAASVKALPSTLAFSTMKNFMTYLTA